MDYLFNDRNIVRDAELTATNVVPSQVIEALESDPRAGGGSVSLTGSYTGQSDATFDLEIVDTSSATPRVSAPVFIGVGNAVLGGLSATGLAAQQFVVTLEDLGTATRAAYAPFQSVTLKAKAMGAGGNAITLAIDASGLTRSATAYAVRAPMSASTSEFVGDEWNFGAPNLNVDGTIPTTAPRIAFGDDPQVYRPYRRYVAGRYVYGFSPALQRDVDAGTRVYTVTGTRSVVISTGGVATDTLTGIVTLYDCLRAIRDSSTLVAVDGVIVHDLLPNGQGVTELSVWTQPYVARTVREGTSYVLEAEVSIVPTAAASTERLQARCVDISTPGRERWELRGDATGAHAQIVTGVPFVDDDVAVLIPRPDVALNTATASISVQYSRPDVDLEDSLPAVSFVRPVLGVAPRNGVYRFVLRPRPAPDCNEVGAMVGGPNSNCLGIIPEGVTDVSEEAQLRRLQRLNEFAADFVRSNTASPPMSRSSSVDQDIEFVKRAAGILQTCLQDVIGATLTLPAWQASTVYALDAMRRPTVANGYRYAVTDPGTSGASEPGSWSTTVGATVTDNGVQWTNIGREPLGMWDDVFAQLQSDAEQLAGVGVHTTAGNDPWEATHAYQVGEQIVVSIEASSPAATPVAALFRCTGDGTSDSTQPTWPTEVGATVTDGGVEWTRIGADSRPIDDAASAIDDAFYERYITACNAVRAAAGLAPDFDVASGQGDGCWRDPDTDVFWESVDGYAPAFSGHYYHSSRHRYDERGRRITESTGEFGFGIRVGCPDLLEIGDVVEVTISGVNGIATYQVGDQITAEITRAVPLEFGGGQTGDDTLTFSVVGDGVGRLDDYALDLTALAAYSDGGLQFAITPGGIALELGARWLFAIEAARWKWRKNAGAWSSPIEIGGTATLSDGLSAAFAAGNAPSWVPGDAWSFRARAVNGVDGIRHLDERRMVWTSSQQLDITPAELEAIGGVHLADHTIPPDATIMLLGSDDDFATAPLAVALTWRARDICRTVVAEHAAYRLTINRGGSMSWVFLGETFRPPRRRGGGEIGRLTKRYRLPSMLARQGAGVLIEHDNLSQAAVDALVASLADACDNERRRFGVLGNADEGDGAIVAIADRDIEVTDLHGFQPRDASQRWLRLALELEPQP